ncbi:hypothetical protein OIU85_029070 [Salix viminalis]|uniref:Protein kinase domain-containing protein n=1 Tax=Salix viminalis TaxID=40686 RepID=A0A9Q0QAK4_SALVM|nr:hypothetical protein OIU85_029070 [Salix viminalis]
MEIEQLADEDCHINNGARKILLGKYEMGRLIGQGTFAKVYRGRNLATQENVAIKVLHKDQKWNDGLLHTQCGTPAYVAPEVLRKKGYDGAKADTWSCGVILFVLLSGHLPFRNENPMRMYVKILKAEYKFPPWISMDAERLISKLLVVDPEKRITIPEIRANSWFRKGLAQSTVSANDSEDDGNGAGSEDPEEFPGRTGIKALTAFFQCF